MRPIYPSRLPYAQELGREETMQAFIKLLEERYGGVEGYVRGMCGLTDQDITTIRQNLLVSKP